MLPPKPFPGRLPQPLRGSPPGQYLLLKAIFNLRLLISIVIRKIGTILMLLISNILSYPKKSSKMSTKI